MAIIGFGNKRYGNFRVKDEIYDIRILFDKTGVLYRNPISALLKEDDLTPNRLCRFFRYEIWDYIKKTKIVTYLFRKYSTHDKNYFDICFRGAEYLDELTEDQLTYLLQTTQNMDSKLNTRISERVRRVNEAKGKLKPILI